MLQLKKQHLLFSYCQSLYNVQFSYVPMRMTKKIKEKEKHTNSINDNNVLTIHAKTNSLHEPLEH